MEQALHRLVRLAAVLCRAPVVAAVLTDGVGDVIEAVHGLAAERWRADQDLRARGLGAGSLLELEDVREDARLSGSILVTGEPGLRFFVSLPLHVGARRGALIVAGTEPRRLCMEEREGLADLVAFAAEDYGHCEEKAFRVTDREYWVRRAESYQDPVLFTVGGEIVYANRAAAEAYGAPSREELVGRTVFEFIDEEQHALMAERQAALERGDIVRAVTYRIRRMDGEVHEVETVSVPVLFEGQQAVQVLVRDITEEQAMAERLRFQAQLLEAVGQAVIATGREGGIIYWNAAAEALYGYRAEEVMGRSILEVTPSPQMLDRAQEIMECLLAGEEWSGEFEVQRKDGAKFWVHVSDTPVLDEEDRLVAVIGVSQDITRRKRDGEQVRLQASALKAAANAIVITDPDGVVTWVNPAFTELTGYPEEEVIGQSIRLLQSGKQDRAFYADLWATILAGFVWRGELINRRKDGRLYTEEQTVTPVLGDDQVIHQFVAIKQDVTKRKQAEQQVRLWKRAIDATSAGVIITDPALPDNPIVEANRGFEALTGYSRQEVIGHNCRFLQQRPDGTMDREQEGLKELREALAERRSCRVVVRNYRRDGIPFWNQLTVSPVTTEDGRVTHFVGVQKDVTSRIEREQDLIKAREEAEEMSQLKDAFLANMSHEIRTPLTAIIGSSEILAEEISGESGELVSFIQQGGERLLEMLTSMLELAQTESGVRPLDLICFDAVRQVRDVLESTRPRADQKGLALTLEAPPGAVMIESDASALDRIVGSLLSNAIKFTPHGEVRVSLVAEDHAIRIEVADTGVGIGEAFLPRLFDPFWQESRGLGRDFEGSGVGLAVVRELVDLLGGTVEVESEKSQGSVFRVTLPRHYTRNGVREEATSPSGDPAARAVGGIRSLPERLRVLVVEDNPGMQILIEHMLSGRYDVEVAGEIGGAMEQALSSRFDLLLLDINLGSGSGVDVLAALRGCEAYRHVPAVAVTAHVFPNDRDYVLKSGFDGYISKPFTRAQLQRTMNIAEAVACNTEAAQEADQPLQEFAAALLERGLIDYFEEDGNWTVITVGQAWFRLGPPAARAVLSHLGVAKQDVVPVGTPAAEERNEDDG